MMMEKTTKTSSDQRISPEEEMSVLHLMTESTDDREKDIQRRLVMLGGGVISSEDDAMIGNKSEEEQEIVDEKISQDEDIFTPVVQDEPLIQNLHQEMVIEKEHPFPTSLEDSKSDFSDRSPVVKPKENALLARIMAAQERAKQAQMKQASQQMTTSVATNLTVEKDKMLEALNGMSLNEIKKASQAPMTAKMSEITSAQKPSGVKSPPLPPSLDIFERQIAEQEQKKAAAVKPPPPPTFDSISMSMMQGFHVDAPSAPPAEDHQILMTAPPTSFDFMSGFTPIAAPPPSFEEAIQFKAPSDDNIVDELDFDLEGTGLTAEEKKKMIEEQRAIMEQIQREAINNKASVAAIKADAFASRMASQAHGQAAGVDGFSANEVEEQRRIYEEIQRQAKGMSVSSSSNSGRRTVDIGGGQQVSIHGQEKTQESIKEGTAQLVECLNCNNWMQVAENATLMFCPICSVVSPVVKGDHDWQVAHLAQMEEDRKLAERLQKEETEAYRQNSTSRSAPRSRSNPPPEYSWWDSVSKGVSNAMVAMGVIADEENDPAHMSVSRPPGAVNPNQRKLHSVTTGEEGVERESLLNAEGGSSSYDRGHRAARVAQPQPLFSCIVDSVANTASAVSSAVYGESNEEDEVNGVDASPLFAIPKAGRERNAGGSYHALPDDS